MSFFCILFPGFIFVFTTLLERPQLASPKVVTVPISIRINLDLILALCHTETGFLCSAEEWAKRYYLYWNKNSEKIKKNEENLIVTIVSLLCNRNIKLLFQLKKHQVWFPGWRDIKLCFDNVSNPQKHVHHNSPTPNSTCHNRWENFPYDIIATYRRRWLTAFRDIWKFSTTRKICFILSTIFLSSFFSSKIFLTS